MSAHQLRDVARQRLREIIDQETAALVNHDQPPDVMNRQRGVIQGLKRAEGVIDDIVKEMSN